MQGGCPEAIYFKDKGQQLKKPVVFKRDQDHLLSPV